MTIEKKQLRTWRIKVFIGTWLSYAGYYFCRKPFYIVKGALSEREHYSVRSLSTIGTAYLTSYSIGQFNAAAIGRFLGPRRMLLAGMSLSLIANIAAGSFSGWIWLLVLMSINGIAQATGWPGNIGTMAQWTRRNERGTIMGIWSTCYQVGGLLAGIYSSFLLGKINWRASFFGGAIVLAIVLVLFFFLQRNKPEDLGLTSIAENDDHDTRENSPSSPSTRSQTWLLNVIIMGSTYFAIKFIRYLFLSWSAYFLQLRFKLSKSKAGYLSNIFDLAGTIGTIVSGIISDRVFGGKRLPVILFMLVGMTLTTFILWRYGSHSLIIFTGGLAMIGFMLYGPDSLLSAAGAIDVGGKNATTTAGIINGIGALGSVIQEPVVGALYDGKAESLSSIFGILFIAAIISLVGVSILSMRAKRGLCRL